MADAFEPRFVDLVRNFSTTQGEGDFALGAAVSGFTSFAAALSPGDRFYYSAVNIDRPVEHEIGRGTLLANNKIQRDPVNGICTKFSSGTKAIALVVAADWYASAAQTLERAVPQLDELATSAKESLVAAVNELAGSGPLFSEIPNHCFPASVSRIVTSGRTAVGEYPAAYIRDPDQSSHTLQGGAFVLILPSSEQQAAANAIWAILERIRIQDADGAYWVIDDESQEVHAGHFGAVGDGVYVESEGVASISGTDNSAAIQALVDWRIYLKYGTASSQRDIVLPPGNFRITRPIRIGYGEIAAIFRSYRLRGAGCGFNRTGGTQVLADFDDHPAVAFNTTRYSVLEDVGFVGRAAAWISAKQLSWSTHGSFAMGIDDRVLANWFDPASPNLDPARRYNPHCAIAIDPYCGAAPANPYADLPEPAFLSAADRRLYNGNSNGSSHVTIRRCRFEGFPVAVVMQPSDYDGNGDWLGIYDSHFSRCPINVSVGNINSRNVHLQRCFSSYAHTILATDLHGKRVGQLGGTVLDCASIFTIQLLKIGPTSGVRDTIIQNWRAEHIHRIADVSNANSEDGGLIRFKASSFLFKHLDGANQRGRPINVVGLSSGGSAWDVGDGILFEDDCFFAEFGSVLPIMVNGVRVGGRVKPSNVFTVLPSQAHARMQNTLAGGLVTPRFQRNGDTIIRYKGRNEGALGTHAQRTTAAKNVQSSRDYPAAHFAQSLSPANSVRCEAIPTPNARSRIKTSSWFQSGASVLTGRTLTFASQITEVQSRSHGLLPGCVLVDDPTGMVFLVTVRTGSSGAFTYTCELQNGYRADGSGEIILDTAFSPNSGSFYWVGGGIFTPPDPLFADMTGGSSELTNVQKGDATVAIGATSPLAPGDLLWRDDHHEFGEINEGVKVLSVTTGGFGTAKYVMSSAVSASNSSRRRLPLWVRGVA